MACSRLQLPRAFSLTILWQHTKWSKPRSTLAMWSSTSPEGRALQSTCTMRQSPSPHWRHLQYGGDSCRAQHPGAALAQHCFSHALQLCTHRSLGLDIFGPHHHTVSTSIEERLYDRPVRWLAVDGNGNRPRISPGGLGHGIELATARLHLSRRDAVGQPAVSMCHYPAQHILGVPANDNGRMRLLGGFGIGTDQGKIEILAMVLRLVIGPQRLHDLNGFPGLRPAVYEVTAHEFSFLTQPARANAEQEAAATKPIKAGDLLSQEEWIALGHQGNARAEFNGASDSRSPGQGDVGIGEMGIGPGDLAASGREGAGAVHRHRGMLRIPDRLET